MILEAKQYFSSNNPQHQLRLSIPHTQGFYHWKIFATILFVWMWSPLFANETVTVNIKGNNGLYLSLNPNLDNFVKAYQEQPGVWETFTLENMGTDSVVINGFNGMTIFLNMSYKSLQGHNDSIHYFTLIEDKAGHYFIKTELDRYLGVESDQYVYASRREFKQAARFFIEQTISPDAPTSFSKTNELLLRLSFGIVILSALAFLTNRRRLGLVLLILGALLLRIFMALIADYLHLWDEQYHALVAKNMMKAPFTPMLYANPVLPYPLLSWIEGHIWLHKQPLFLWQMAASMKLFGTNLFAMRLPSILMSTAVVWFTYLLGSKLVDKKTGFYGAFFFALGNYGLQLVNGYHSTDHNDVAFLFYVTATLVAWVIYWQSRRTLLWAIIVGALTGMAVLVKWLPGLLVFSGWLVVIIFHKNAWSQKNILHFLAAAAVCALIFMPWQAYTLIQYPEIAQHELMYNTAHVNQAVERHEGNALFHFQMAKKHLGIPFLALFVGWLLIIRRIRSAELRTAIVVWVSVVYIVFTVAQTKMPSFTFMIAALNYLAAAQLIITLFNIIIINPKIRHAPKWQTVFTILIIGFIGWNNIEYKALRARHTLWRKTLDDPYKNRILTQKLMYHLAEDTTDKTVFFHARPFDNIPIMFFTNATAAYDRMLTPDEIKELKSRGYRLRVFDDGNLPDYIYEHDIDIINNYWYPL